ncbi:MAG TPA: hypothetical protein VJR23_09525 [Candidatus Acidoferrales bacterium]|nr:hypothetical protein [Candidatus Acidoferrales bacterium]
MPMRIKGGTPEQGESKCYTCSNAHVVKGYRESEELVVCQALYPERLVQFPVRECTGYSEIKRQTLKQMEDMAWILSERGKRAAGFVPPPKENGKEDEIELILSRGSTLDERK